jgi:hypothetical protein
MPVLLVYNRPGEGCDKMIVSDFWRVRTNPLQIT